MKVVITGAHGFLGWHTASRMRAQLGIEPIRLGRDDVADPNGLAAAVADADVVMHLAGVNRAESDEAVHQGNVDLAQSLGTAIVAGGRPLRVVYANSIQSDLDNAYGRGKAAAAAALAEAVDQVGGSFADVLLPNLFGEHGRPYYNSFVATFCYLIATGGQPTVLEDRAVDLLHAQAAAQCLIDAWDAPTNVQTRPQGETRQVSEILEILRGFHDLYSRGDVPGLSEPFLVDLFNTYRSYLFPAHFPVRSQVHADARGELVETVRSHGGTGQFFVSTTRPGFTRGDHYHLHKIERFFVVRGRAEIALRRLLDDEVVTFQVDGSEPGFVDMPTLWVHNITNVGEDDLVTVFWADQLLNRDHPDQYPEMVRTESAR